MAAGELTAGTGLEVGLKVDGLLLVAEGNGGLDAPGAILGRVRAAAGVVGLEAGLEVRSAAGVVAGGVGLAGQDIYVMETGSWHG